MWRWIVPIFVAALAVPLTSLPAAAAPPANASPQVLVLRLSDLPSGFIQVRGNFNTNAQAARQSHVSVATLEHNGRVTAYEVEFRRNARSGVVEALNRVVQYKTAADAHKVFRQGVRQARHLFRPMATGAVGNESAGYLITRETNGLSVTVATIVFRQGPYISELEAAGLSGTFNPSTAAHVLAAIVSQRITHA